MQTALFILVALFTGLALWFFAEKRRRKIRPVQGGIDRSISIPSSNEIELYSNSFSHCSRKARLVLAELEIKTKHHSIDLIETGSYQTISPAYLQVNPSGLVPTMVHMQHPIYESDEILAYAQSIAGHDAPQLVPSEPEQLKQMHSWLDFCAISSDDAMAQMESRAGACVPGLTLPMFVAAIQYVPLRNILIGFLFHFDRRRPALFFASKLLGLRRMMALKPIREMMHTSRDHMLRHLEVLNKTLTDHEGEWILGETYTLADLSIGCLLLRLDETGWLDWFQQSANIDALLAYYARIKARRAWREAIFAHAHPIVTQAQEDLKKLNTSDRPLRMRIYGQPVEHAT